MFERQKERIQFNVMALGYRLRPRQLCFKARLQQTCFKINPSVILSACYVITVKRSESAGCLVSVWENLKLECHPCIMKMSQLVASLPWIMLAVVTSFLGYKWTRNGIRRKLKSCCVQILDYRKVFHSKPLEWSKRSCCHYGFIGYWFLNLMKLENIYFGMHTSK